MKYLERVSGKSKLQLVLGLGRQNSSSSYPNTSMVWLSIIIHLFDLKKKKNILFFHPSLIHSLHLRKDANIIPVRTD